MPPFQIGVQIRTSWGQLHSLDPDSFQDPCEGLAKLGVPIVQQITAAIEETDLRQAQIACHLRHPTQVGRSRDSSDADVSCRHPHTGEHLVSRQATGSPQLRGEVVDRSQDFQVRADELAPTCGAFTLGVKKTGARGSELDNNRPRW